MIQKLSTAILGIISILIFTQSCEVMKSTRITVCKNIEDLNGKNNQMVIIEGVYTLHNPFQNQKLTNQEDLIAKIVFENSENEIFLEPYWHPDAKRPFDETTKFQGKTVLVKGIYNEKQPTDPSSPPYATSFGGACISSVKNIRLSKEK